MKKKLPSSVALLLILIAGFRIINLEADPPADFGWSGGYFADEGFWSHNARNKALFGSAVQDEWDARVVSPVFAYFQEWIFQLLGPGILQVRLIAILTSLVIALLSYALFRTQFEPQEAFLFGVLVSLNYPMMVLGRQGILDPFAAAFLMSAVLLLNRNSQRAAFFGGLLFVGACITKYLMVYALVPCLYLVWQSRKYISFFAGIIIAGALWLILNYLPNRDLLLAYNSYYASQQSWDLASLIRNIATQPFFLYFVKTPALLCFANLGIWFFLSGSGSRWSKLEKMCIFWLITGILFFALWKYRPFRYYTSLIPPMAAVAVIMLYRLKNGWNPRFRSRFVLYAGLLLPVAQFVFVLADRFTGWGIVPPELGIHWLEPLLFICLSGFVFLFLRTRNARVAISAFLVVFLLSDFRNYISWVLRPEFQAVQISRDLDQRAPDGIITGQWAPELCLNNKLRVVPVWHGFVNSKDPFNKYGITHVLQWKYSLGGEKFEDWYPEFSTKFRYVTTYRIKDSDVLLYEKIN